MESRHHNEPLHDIAHDVSAEDFFPAIIDNAPGLVFTLDRNFHFLTTNAVLKNIVLQRYGITLNAGDSVFKAFDHINPIMADKWTTNDWKEMFHKAFAGEQFSFVKEFIAPKHSFWQFTISPVKQNNEVVFLVCYAFDITPQKLNELKLRQNEERNRIVGESPVTCIAWYDAKGNFIHANQAFCDLAEASYEELKKKRPEDFLPPDDLKTTVPYFEQVINQEIEHYHIERRYISLKKNVKWVELSVTAQKNEQGEIQQIVVVAQDITAKKKTEESLRKSETNMRYILDNSDSAFLLLDTNFKILLANHLADKWALSEIGILLNEGEYFPNYFPEMYHAAGIQVLEKVLGGIPHAYEAKYTKRDANESWYHVRLAPVADNEKNIIGICIVASDTTKRKEAEAEIKSLNDSLERKVKERTIALEEANKELEAFTYSVSHDLLSPLRNIDSFIDILIEDYRNKLNEDGQHTLSIIKKNSTLMGCLIEDLLNFARFGKVPLKKQLVNMNGVVSEVIDELRFSTNKLEAKINLHDMNPAHCDPQLIKQVWVNLLSNAIKYSRTKENPEIEIGSAEKDGDIIYFIRDNGIGFDMKFSDKLFGVFNRLHKSTEFEGTGVGLAIVHRIITKHGGKIWAESKEGEGTVFNFTL